MASHLIESSCMKYKRFLPYVLVVLATVEIYFLVGAVNKSGAEKELVVPEMEDGLLKEPQNYKGMSWLVPGRHLFNLGLTEEELPPINEPKFVGVTAADEILDDGVFGIHVTINGKHRFYSNQILNWHEVVNDSFEGRDIAVTLSTLSRSGIVYDRLFDGKTLTFGNLMMVYNNNSILSTGSTPTDREGDFWLQGTGVSIYGSHQGEKLTVVPSESITWAEFKDLYPEGEVLSAETGFDREYARHPYSGYDNSDLLYFPLLKQVESLDNKWMVNVVQGETETIAFAETIEKGFGATNEMLDGNPIAAFWDFEQSFTRVFSAEVDGQKLTFDYNFESETITDSETGTTWTSDGRGVRGKLAGKQLTQLNAPQFFWGVWYNLKPSTRVSRVDTITEEPATAPDIQINTGIPTFEVEI